MKINLNQLYKIVDTDLVNGFIVVTGKQLTEVLEESYKELMESKKETV